jgi:hypothetical protein
MFDLKKMMIKPYEQPKLKYWPEPETKVDPMAVELFKKMQSRLGMKLSGYFDFKLDVRPYDNIVQTLYNCKALGVAWDSNIDTAFERSISTGLLPTLKVVQKDLNEIISVLEQGYGPGK